MINIFEVHIFLIISFYHIWSHYHYMHFIRISHTRTFIYTPQRVLIFFYVQYLPHNIFYTEMWLYKNITHKSLNIYKQIPEYISIFLHICIITFALPYSLSLNHIQSRIIWYNYYNILFGIYIYIIYTNNNTNSLQDFIWYIFDIYIYECKFISSKLWGDFKIYRFTTFNFTIIVFLILLIHYNPNVCIYTIYIVLAVLYCFFFFLFIQYSSNFISNFAWFIIDWFAKFTINYFSIFTIPPFHNITFLVYQ